MVSAELPRPLPTSALWRRCSLLRSHDPAEIRDIIKQTATDLGSKGRDDLYGNGLINAFAAMIRATQTDNTTVTLVTVGLREPLHQS